jgi:predicted aldo/keto reductase-like oxidoreductase
VAARTQAQTIYDSIGFFTHTLTAFFLFGSSASQYHAAQTKCDYCCQLGHGCYVDAVNVSVVAEETFAEVQSRRVYYRTVFDAVTVCEAQPAKAFRCVGREDGSCISRSGDGGD